MRYANPVRLLILGLLAGGPLHGHQIRRTAEMTGIEQWGGVKVGALYGMLHRMEGEGLIEPARTEQAGNRPQRTVYRITDEGFQELTIHRDRALTQPAVHSTTVEAALKWLAGLDRDGLRDRLSQRRHALENALAELTASREMHLQEDHLSQASLAGYRRAELHLQAELAWQAELEPMLPAIAKGDPRDRPTPEPSAEVTPIRRSS
ncbi:MAG TPA: PadR family transcriptional regulator [Mycobacteriales bacterium]|nr:PadR family transcriptional regulator [Mycobacteriales bacterium]